MNNDGGKRKNADYKWFYEHAEKLLKRYLADVRLDGAPASLADYLARVVTPTLESQKREGAVALALPLAVLRLHAADRPNDTASSAPSGSQANFTVKGIVVDPSGKPVTGAKVAVLAKRKRSTADRDTPRYPDVLGMAESGREGRFSVSVPLAAELRDTVPLPIALHAADLARGKRVMVIDDDPSLELDDDM